MAAAAIFDFMKYQIFNDRNGHEGRTVPSGQISSKSLEPRPRYGDYSIFQYGDRRHIGFLKFKKILTVGTVKKVELHQCAKFRRNLFNRAEIYDFQYYANLTWKCLFMPPILGRAMGHISPKWCHSSS